MPPASRVSPRDDFVYTQCFVAKMNIKTNNQKPHRYELFNVNLS